MRGNGIIVMWVNGHSLLGRASSHAVDDAAYVVFDRLVEHRLTQWTMRHMCFPLGRASSHAVDDAAYVVIDRLVKHRLTQWTMRYVGQWSILGRASSHAVDDAICVFDRYSL